MVKAGTDSARNKNKYWFCKQKLALILHQQPIRDNVSKGEKQPA